MKTVSKPFPERIANALADPGLEERVRLATARFAEARIRSFAEWPDREEWRERARAIRKEAIDNLDHYLRKFMEHATQAGAQVHAADTQDDAARIVADIAAKHGAALAVKSKSMVSEEIRANEALQRVGVRPVETDLGEYIVQLAHEPPSHIIGPAIHKNREQIAQLFSNERGERIADSTAALGGFAKERLRQEFLQADIGISGVNFGVAETGTVVLVSNEGNARMVTSKPRVHIALMGMERVIPRLDDLHVLLQMLTRSATGQPITTYVTLLTGPRQPQDADGPEELHIVILDGGRSKLLGTHYQEALHCIRCGACLNVCPVFRQIGGHGYGSVYSGPIGAVLTPLLTGLNEWADLPYASSLCGACTEVCPVKIPLHEYLIDLRADVVAAGLRPTTEKAAFAAYRRIMRRPAQYRTAVRAVRAMQWLVTTRGRIRAKLGPLSGWTSYRTLRPLARESFRDRFAKMEQRVFTEGEES